MNSFSIWILLFLILSGCTWGHPVKTTDKVVESDLLGEYRYRNKYIIEFKAKGQAIQKLNGKEIELNWSINNNEISISDLIEGNDGKTINHGKQTYIISHDYRDYYYPFGAPDDFDNYEIWNKVK